MQKCNRIIQQMRDKRNLYAAIGKQIIKPYSECHTGTLLIIGSSKDALKDLKQAQQMRPCAKLMAVGHAAGLVKVDFVVSDHYEVHRDLRKLQNKFGYGHYTTHCSISRNKVNQFPEVDYWWNWRRAEASSVQTAIRVGIAVGFKEIILCGCPLEHGVIQHIDQRMKDGWEWPPARDVEKYGHVKDNNTSAEILKSFRKHFTKCAAEWNGFVFSMSGFTKQVLGPPPEEPDYTIKTKYPTMRYNLKRSFVQPKKKHNITLPASVQRAVRKWSGAKGSSAVYPKRYDKWPAGDSPKVLGELCKGLICEIGCGTGRCCEAFKPNMYIGLDINSDAVRKAKRSYPRYKFKQIEWYDDYPIANTYLFYTVLLHIPDDAIEEVLRRTLRSDDSIIVIFETMMRKYRNENNGNFQRDVKEYEEILKQADRKVVDVIELPETAQLPKRHYMVAR